MVRILYFASLRENLGLADESINEPVTTVAELLDLLAQRGQLWDEQLRQNTRLQIAVNQTMTKREAAITTGDEIAFFPPVTGG
jgi:molybdopterin synthase sulfur carrier subunit